jgi:SNF2 family DNA or RNA helicase
MICSDTFEEKIDAMVEAKKEIASLTTQQGESWIGKMSDGELREMFSLSASPAGDDS